MRRFVLAAILMIFASAAESGRMPYLPIHLAKPFAGITERTRIAGAEALGAYFAARGYVLTAVREACRVPPLYVLTVPPGLAAQAIDESGWGTSFFAREAIALFGEHETSPVDGDYVTTPNGRVKVAHFDNIYHAVAAYVHTLNTTQAYSGLRERRAAARAKGRTLTGYGLAEGLLHYSARGRAYVDTLRRLIRGHRLELYYGIRLDAETPAVLIEVGADLD